MAERIPIRIRNTFNPQHPGTLISSEPAAAHPVKGITSIDDVALVNVEGAGMIGVPGTAERLFGALRAARHLGHPDFAGAVPSTRSALPCRGRRRTRAVAVVREAFARELTQGQIQRIEALADCSIVAVVGDGMAGTPGVAAKLFGALSSAGVNVRAIAQGASERNISAMIAAKDLRRALGAVHASFYLSPHTISIGVIGPGLVGSAFIEQLALADRPACARHFNLDLRLRGILSSRRMCLAAAADRRRRAGAPR